MSHKTIDNLISVKNEIKKNNKSVEIIAVSKTFPLNNILPLIDYGHVHFGENKVQEASTKWTSIKHKNKNIRLHMIGKLQTNKVKNAIQLFDYIHSLDNLKLANKISIEQKKNNKNLKIFIQVNIGNENQKNGISIQELDKFYYECTSKLGLNIIGLMCIPPADENTKEYFQFMSKLNISLGLKELSMGMSYDYIEAIKYGSTFVRVGSSIFGNRL